MIKIKTISSLEKVFFEFPDNAEELVSETMMRNEIYSFQLAIWAENLEKQRTEYRLEIESVIKDCISVKQVGYVPSTLPCYEEADDDYISKTPGLFPDPLYTLDKNSVVLAKNQARAFWVAIEPSGKYAGKFPIIFKLYDDGGVLVGVKTFEIEILDINLPELDIYNTGWFHGDCIATYHNVDITSIEYWVLIRRYLAVYVKMGHNMILTPVFTPPLDTEEGGERPTNQLVEITVNSGRYSFDFEKLKEWIFVCRECGIKYFEISHLFTQWGAKHAPKVMATVNGKYKKIFGWETDSLSKEYIEFLNDFLRELVKVLQQEEIYNECFFHISDEPELKDVDRYKKLKGIFMNYISEEKIIDAVSAYEFYKSGAIKNPIVPNDKINVFIDNNVSELWTYYCCAQGIAASNRFMAMPSYRNRILGMQLYKNHIKGFLQWGFNFWFSQYSKKKINPYQDTTADGGFPSGDAYIIYPIDENGKVVYSLRLYVFNEALQDYRAMSLLESLAGREKVVELLEEITGFMEYPRNSQYIINIRREINKRIKKLI